jgi:hypothetical protein
MSEHWRHGEAWAAALRERIVAWLESARHGTSREMAHYFRQTGGDVQDDTISARCNELEAEGRIVQDGRKGAGPGRPCIVWTLPQFKQQTELAL